MTCHSGSAGSSDPCHPERPGAPPRGGTAWDVFDEGDDLYDAMASDIAAAASDIRMESYIFASDAVGNRIAATLAAQARRGRRVHLRVDYAGSRLALDDAVIGELRKAGAVFEWSRRWQWRRPWEFHRRNHRKLLIVDESVAYTGGFNVHAASSRRAAGAGRWRDTHVRIVGPPVRQAVGIFDGTDGETQAMSSAASAFRLIPNATRHCRWRWRCELDAVLRAATRRVWLTTPYFVPDRRLRRRLVRAARRGVDVRVLLPARSDVSIAQWAARAHYAGLLRHGVRVHEYQPRMLHAKTLVVDNGWAAVGTGNFDYRSLFVNAEVNLIAQDERFCAALASQFSTDLDSSHEIDPGHWRRRSFSSVAREAFAWRIRRWL